MSPVAARLVTVCERWTAELLELPENTAMSLVTGSATRFCAPLPRPETGF